ncbi:MAG: 4'-phosphopantetheinyl transferase superfamily protein [Clostridia bacterium]|jgi:4'-phosphopantetheinyl transferase|nr:4'-phosphopantetheinyl transferase superfamily protein [Clostridia bacterium]MDD3093503.1 4'-phosphopantetheinyl transferase superfamily protein [Clostridia bacterium]MDD3971605.1 4'-phosphopantetheinyl transferase superfamily protein [Clostridia bacterium]
MIEVYILEAETNTTDNTSFKNLLRCISDDKLNKITNMRNDMDKKLTVFADILIRIVASQRIFLSNRNLFFQKDLYGKPYLLSYPDFQYNISHTRNAVAVTFSNKPIGIDIEKIRQPDQQIVKRFFTPDENRYIMQSNNFAVRFFEIWTKKEAHIKHDGRGLSIPLDSFSVLVNREKYYTYKFKDYIVALYRENLYDKITVRHLEEDDLYKQAKLLDYLS